MKITRISFLSAFWVLGLNLTAQNVYLLRPTEVMVYLQGALMMESAEVQFEKGIHKLVLYHGSDALQTQQLTLSAPEGVKVMSIRRHQISESPHEYIPQLGKIQDSIEDISNKMNELQTEKLILDKELELLNKNMQVSGSQNGLVLEELRKTAEYLRTRLKQIYLEIDKIAKSSDELKKVQNDLQERYQETLLSMGVTNTALEVNYFAERNLSSQLSLGYLISQASWTPFYNLRAEKLNEPLELEYMAKLRNQSGKDWNKVKIQLSTYDPFQYGGMPVLPTWYLDFQAKSEQVGLSNQYSIRQKAMRSEVMSEDDVEESAAMPVTVVRENSLSLQYELGGTFSIPNGTQEETVFIQSRKIRGNYRHVSIPKADRDAFLICSVYDWNALELLEGNLLMYLEGTYVGNSQIQTRYAGDSLDLSMGRDKKVIVNRTKSLDFTKKQFIGSKITENRAYDINVRNLRSTPVKIELLDQVPVSLKSEIEVNVTELSGASWNKDNGRIMWKSELQPNETKSFKLAFNVKYPKDNPVDVQ